ncbi:hypothetical protein BLA29_005067, partial [Euroglyphus maynei]
MGERNRFGLPNIKSQPFIMRKVSSSPSTTTTSNPILKMDMTMPDVIESRKHTTVQKMDLPISTTTTTTTTRRPSSLLEKINRIERGQQTPLKPLLNPWNKREQSLSEINNDNNEQDEIVIRRPPGMPKIPNNFGFANVIIPDQLMINTNDDDDDDGKINDENSNKQDKESFFSDKQANIAKYEL